MCPKLCGRAKKLPNRMTIPRANGARESALAAASENFHQLLRRHDFELRIRAVARLLIAAPSSEVRHVAKTRALHVLVGDSDDQLGPQRSPRQVPASAPAALAARHASVG